MVKVGRKAENFTGFLRKFSGDNSLIVNISKSQMYNSFQRGTMCNWRYVDYFWCLESSDMNFLKSVLRFGLIKISSSETCELLENSTLSYGTFSINGTCTYFCLYSKFSFSSNKIAWNENMFLFFSIHTVQHLKIINFTQIVYKDEFKCYLSECVYIF